MANITGIAVDASAEPAPELLADAWILSWRSIGGEVTIGPAAEVVPWMHFTDRDALRVTHHLMNQLLDTPGLPLAVRTLLGKASS